MSLGGGGQIPKGGRAGRARSPGIWPRGVKFLWDLAPGGEITGRQNPWDTGLVLARVEFGLVGAV